MREYTTAELERGMKYLSNHQEMIDGEIRMLIRSIVSPKIKSTTEQIADDAINFANNFKNIPEWLQDSIAKEINAKSESADVTKMREGITKLGIPEMHIASNGDKSFSIDRQ